MILLTSSSCRTLARPVRVCVAVCLACVVCCVLRLCVVNICVVCGLCSCIIEARRVRVLRCVCSECGELTLCDAGVSEMHTYCEDAYTSGVHTDRAYTQRGGEGQKRGEGGERTRLRARVSATERETFAWWGCCIMPRRSW